MLKTLGSRYLTSLFDAPGNSMDAIVQQATSLISACYGYTNCSTMSETRLKVWLSKMGRGTSTPKLCTLPPTTEAFRENVLRAHHRALIWMSLHEQNFPKLDTTGYGRIENVKNRSLQPITLPDDIELAPEIILRLIRCGCHSTTPCSSHACSCHSANMKCT